MDPSCYNHLNALKKGPDIGYPERLTRLTRKALTAFDISTLHTSESLGLLVLLGCAIAGSTPVAYLRHRL